MTQESLHQTAGELARLDTLLEHRTHLGACVLFPPSDAISFSRLLDLLQDQREHRGASAQIGGGRIYSGGQEIRSGKPFTTYALKSVGRKAIKAHFDALKGLIQSSFG